jgi:acetyl esterase
MKRLLFPLIIVLTLAATGWVFLPKAHSQQRIIEMIEAASEAQLQLMLPRYPKADRNGDGVLSKEEALAYAKQQAATAKTPAPSTKGLAPTFANLSYGPHERNQLDVWQAAGEGPRPLVIFIHGGGFMNGDKSKWASDKNLKNLLDRGISCAAINYRFRQHAPVQDILRDAARAIQFLRSRAGEWQLDPQRFAAWGSSAGAGTSLWLGSRDDLADPENADPILRESSRVQAVVLNAVQATYNLVRWESFLGPGDPKWWRSANEAAEFYHLSSIEDLTSPAAQAILRECDMLAWIDAGDAPVYVSNPMPDTPVKDRGHYLHHPAHAREVQKHCQQASIPCCWKESPESPSGSAADPVAFLVEHLSLAN